MGQTEPSAGIDEPLPSELESCSATRERGGANVNRLFSGTVANDAFSGTVATDAAAAVQVIIAGIIVVSSAALVGEEVEVR